MKRILVVASLVILCLAVVYGVPRYRVVREAARRQQYLEDAAKNEVPLVLDAKTEAILSGADRVETFRLAGGGDEELTSAEQVALHGPHPQYFENYSVMSVGPPQGKAFAASLQRALSQVSGEVDGAQCFDPGVGFRVWKAKAHVDVCVCFYCSGVQITTPYASPESIRQNPYHQPTMLGESRPALLALSKQAFPQDARLAALN